MVNKTWVRRDGLWLSPSAGKMDRNIRAILFAAVLVILFATLAPGI
jgi:hypothetical protein